MSPSLPELAEAVGGEVLRPARGTVARVGLALDVTPEVLAWTAELDVLVLHRSHALGDADVACGVVGSHDWLDAQIVPWLAASLGMTDPEPLAGDPRALTGRTRDGEVVVVAGAMTPALVTAAAQAGAQLYVTGQWRVWAQDAVAETGLEVFALGHDTWEGWALGELARRLRAQWPDVEFLSAR